MLALLRDAVADEPSIGLTRWEWQSKSCKYPKIPGETTNTKGVVIRAAYNALADWWATSDLTPPALPTYATRDMVAAHIKKCFPGVPERVILPQPKKGRRAGSAGDE